MKNTKKRVGKFIIIGIILTIFNFLVYTFIGRVILNNNDLLWLDSMVSYALATILAYILHSKITWKERHVTKTSVLMFFLWNGITAFLISPFFTWLFGFLTPFYQSIHQLCANLNLPFDYNFVESTGIYLLVAIVTLILNYLFYDKLVFGTSKKSYSAEEKTYSGKNQPKISIIIPVYNTAKYLPKCLNSVTSQTYSNLEIILVDDGSTDDSKKIADTYAKKDPRIKVSHQENQGQSAARNAGLQKATGDFIGFTDSDDQLKPTFINSLLEIYGADTSLAVCGHQYHWVKKNTSKNLYQSPLRPRRHHETKKVYVLKLLAKDGRLYSCNNKLFKASIIKDHQLKFDQKLNFAEDTKFVLDYLKHAEGEIAYTPQPLYIYNFGTDSSTIKTSATIWQNWQTSYKNLKSWLGSHPTPSEKFWLHVIHLRWRISFIRSKRRAK